MLIMLIFSVVKVNQYIVSATWFSTSPQIMSMSDVTAARDQDNPSPRMRRANSYPNIADYR